MTRFCSQKIAPAIKSYNTEAHAPYIFIYPIFELNIQDDFWNFKKEKPYSLPTTCFYTELADLKGKNIKMRISGAKTISSDMSYWFFNNLINIIFHEGLYRQTRDKKNGNLLSKEPVYTGLENRLEDFAGKLMTTFHEYTSENLRRRIAGIALYASIVGIILAIASLIVSLLK